MIIRGGYSTVFLLDNLCFLLISNKFIGKKLWRF